MKVKYPQGAAGWANFPNYGNRSTASTPTVAVISNFPSASPIRLGQSLANSRLTGGTANVGGTFDFENTNTVPPGGLSSQSVLFRPDLWYLDKLKFEVQVQVWTNIPLLNIPATLTAYVGKPFSYTVEASDGPSHFSATGLPEGFSIEPSAGKSVEFPAELEIFLRKFSPRMRLRLAVWLALPCELSAEPRKSSRPRPRWLCVRGNP